MKTHQCVHVLHCCIRHQHRNYGIHAKINCEELEIAFQRICDHSSPFQCSHTNLHAISSTKRREKKRFLIELTRDGNIFGSLSRHSFYCSIRQKNEQAFRKTRYFAVHMLRTITIRLQRHSTKQAQVADSASRLSVC